MIYLELFFTFLKIGAFTFGGGYAMLPLIQEAVLHNGWLTAGELVDFVAVSESTPGPFAVNIATYVGRQTAGIPGAVCATLGVVLPSFVIIIIVAKCFDRFKASKAVKGIMYGLKPAVIGLIAAAAVSVGETALFHSGVSVYPLVCSLVIFSAAVFLVFKKHIHPVTVILVCAALGILSGYMELL